MVNNKIISAAIIMAVGFSWSQETLRSLAAERGRYVGSILNSEWFNNQTPTNYESTHKAQFNLTVPENEMKFDALEPSQNNFNWTKADKIMEYAEANGMRIRGHALAWHSQVPGWVSNGTWTKASLLAVLKNHILTVVGHYKGRIHEWDVVNEAITDGSPRTWRGTNGDESSIWGKIIGPEFIDSAFVWAHQADPSAELYYNDYGIEWGTGTGTKAKFLLDAIDNWKANGIPITGVGTQTHVANTHTATPANVRTLAKALATRGLTLQITELDIGYAQGTTPSVSDLQAQGHLYGQFMDVFLEEPNMNSFMIWGFTDAYSWLPQQKMDYGLIYDKSINKKPAYDSLIASLKRHDPSTVITPGGSTSSSSLNVSSSSSVTEAQAPYNGIKMQIPGIIEAENYDLGGEGVSYHDTDNLNEGANYRNDGVDVAGDGNTGYVIAYTGANEWLEYTIDVQRAGVYNWQARVASGADNCAFHVLVDGTMMIDSTEVPNTTDWSTYTTISGVSSSLAAGEHVIRIVIDGPYFNLDWFSFSDSITPINKLYINSLNANVGLYRLYSLRGDLLGKLDLAEGEDLRKRIQGMVNKSGMYIVVNQDKLQTQLIEIH